MHSYTIPAETGFRNLNISAEVTDLTPDGFTADPSTACSILAQLAEENGLVFADQWDALNADGAERLLVWESEEAAENDPGVNAMCQIERLKA